MKWVGTGGVHEWLLAWHSLKVYVYGLLLCSSSLREEVRRRETPALNGHLSSLTLALSLREREQNVIFIV
jgi:hypothetical protein